jgi:hypothetical protein
MLDRVWLNEDAQFAAGREVFRSDREFLLWAYTVSHGQLLLRTPTTSPAGTRQSRIDVLFKPVAAVKVRSSYDGLAIRCASEVEARHVLHAAGLAPGSGHRVLLLGTARDTDYVVAGAVGWLEDAGDARDPSGLASFVPGTDPGRILGGR